jgi:hypothetical protein
MNTCPIHNQPLKTVPAGVSKSTGRPYNAFEVCPERGCSYRPPRQQNYAPSAPARNFDKEAYEKCVSIWVKGELGQPIETVIAKINSGYFWELFQAIRKDGEKRFATGWDRAVKTFGTDTDAPSDYAPLPEPPPEYPV